MDNDRDAANRPAMSPSLQAALFSSSFESWRRKHHKYPVYLPPQASLAAPASIKQITPRVMKAIETKEQGGRYVRNVMARQLTDCKYPDVETFTRACGMEKDQYRRTSAPQSNAHNPPSPQIDIDFEPDSAITHIAISSFFPGVTRASGGHLVGLADPVRWPTAARTFFKNVVTGTLNGRKFCKENVERDRPYRIYEQVEWSWAPRLEASGGMINVLEIDPSPSVEGALRAPHAFVKVNALHESRSASAKTFARKVLVEVDRELDTNEKGLSVEGVLSKYAFGKGRALAHRDGPPPVDGTFEANYSYRLVRCLQSKFLSTWEVGGIDLDDGTYRALWCPEKDNSEVGGLFIQVIKYIRYTPQADVFPGHSQLLNLLSPAVASMLLRQIAFDSVSEQLAKLQPREGQAEHSVVGK